MGIARNLASWGLHRLAETELLWSQAGDRTALRKLYLRHMKVTFRKTVWIGPDFYLRFPGNLALGERCGLGGFCRIWNYSPITIGDDFLSAAGLLLNTAGHDPETLQPFSREIRIGNRVWCGVNVTILAGVTIGDDVVIGAGSVVVHDIPPKSIAVGVPARKVRDLARDGRTPLWGWAR
jgi:maltose O-acetyltransferase